MSQPTVFVITPQGFYRTQRVYELFRTHTHTHTHIYIYIYIYYFIYDSFFNTIQIWLGLNFSPEYENNFDSRVSTAIYFPKWSFANKINFFPLSLRNEMIFLCVFVLVHQIISLCVYVNVSRYSSNGVCIWRIFWRGDVEKQKWVKKSNVFIVKERKIAFKCQRLSQRKRQKSVFVNWSLKKKSDRCK